MPGGRNGGGALGGPPRAGIGGGAPRTGGFARIGIGNTGGAIDGGEELISALISLGRFGTGGGLPESTSSLGGNGGAGGKLCHGLRGGVSSSSSESTRGGKVGGG